MRWKLSDRSKKVFAGTGKIFLRIGRSLVWTFGWIFLVMIVLAFTSLPFHAHRALGTAAGLCENKVDFIVVLGGSGMPSGPELLRLHHAAEFAGKYQTSRVMVVHPKDSAVMRSMVEELLMRGIMADRIDTMLRGTSTREQALELVSYPRIDRNASIAIVTAPENMYRSVQTFRKAGFKDVCGLPAFDHAMFIDLEYDHKKLGGSGYVPDVSDDTSLRYTFWNYLKLEITCLREYAAIGYYRINGWI